MQVRTIRTRLVTAGACTIEDLLDEALDSLNESSVLAVSSKVIALCEGRTKPVTGTDLKQLVRQEADQFMPDAKDAFGYTFTITNGLLTPNSGIDQSNGNGDYVLWPEDPWKSASNIRSHLMEKFGVKELGVIIIDKDCLPLRWGATGLTLAYSGINALRSYKGQVDLFGRPLSITTVNVADCLASAATLLMGEGAEQTPLAVLEDLINVEFVDSDPTDQEIAERRPSLEDDFFGPFLSKVNWQSGGRESKTF